MLYKAKAANSKLETGAVQGAGRKLGIDNAEGVHINFRHFALLVTKDDGLVKSHQTDGKVKSFRCKARES